MAADAESNIRIGFDTSDALASLKALQREISNTQKELQGVSSANNAQAQNLQRRLIQDINATGKFSARITQIQSSTEQFTTALEKNKLSMGQYFSYGASQIRGFRNTFTKEYDTIEKVARERVKTLQTQYISLGRDANGALRSIAVRPLRLDMNDLATQTAINAQKQQIFNQLLKQGSTNLLNFGKNTQWAGRQLMVGFTIPLSILGSTAAKTFMEMEEQAIRFKRVYGELFTPPQETDQMLGTLTKLGEELTKYGIAVKDTLSLAADAAAMGKTGADLTAQVAEASRLAVLGGVQQQQALETTISLTNAFGVSAEQLSKKVDFLNAVENQTVVSIEDLTEAIPKAGPVIQQLGGNVEDLAFFLTAMKEGGINASEGANALKSGLASLINPTQQASDMLSIFGINIREIVRSNAGNVKGIVVDFAKALDQLNPQQRAQAIEQLFGKFQFSRISTLFQNVIAEGSQASRVLELANATTSELAQLSAKELSKVEESTTYKFRGAIEEFKSALAPVGEEFMKLVTPLIEFGTKVLKAFDGMTGGAKSFVTSVVAILGGLAPVALMTFGLLANGVANIIKGFTAVRNVFLGVATNTNMLGEQVDYMTQQQLEAAAVASSLEQQHMKLEQRFTSEATAVAALANAYLKAVAAGNKLTGVKANVGTSGKTRKMKSGGVVIVPGSGKGDKVPAMLEPGEAVIPSAMTEKYAGLINSMIAGKIPGYQQGKGSQGRLMPVAGGFDSSHFASAVMLPIEEAIALLKKWGMENTTAFTNLQKAMQSGIKSVKAFSNEIVALPTEINKGLGEQGSGKTLPASQIKAAVSKSAPGMNVELTRQLRNAGLNDAQIQQRIDRVNALIAQGLEKFDDKVMMTAEDLDGVIKSAYAAAEKVEGKTDAVMKKANKAMQEITTLKDPISRAAGGQDRIAGPGSYANFRSGYETEAVKGGMGARSAFRATPEMLSALKISEEKLKADLAKMSVAQQQSVATLAVAANKSKDYSKLSSELEQIRVQNSRKSKKAADQEAVAAVEEEKTAKKRAATATKRKRVADQEAQTVVVDQNAARNRARSASGNTVASMQSMNAKVMGVTGVLSTLTMVAGIFGSNLGAAGDALMTLSNTVFALSAVMQMLSATTKGQAMMQAGSEMAGMMGGTGKGAAKRKWTVAKDISGKAIKGGVAGGKVGAIFNNLGNVANAAVGPLGTLGKIALRAVPWIGAALLAFEAFKFVSGIIEEQKAKITGLGDAAFMTAEKMKSASDLLGFEVTGNAAFGGLGTAGSASGANTTQQQKIDELKANTDFQDQFKNEISALKAANAQQAQAVLNSMAVQMAASGAPQEAIETFMKALAQSAGQTKLDMKFASIDLSTADGLQSVKDLANSAVADLNTAFETGFTPSQQVTGYLGTVYGQAATYSDDLKKQAEITASTISSTFTALNVGLTNGTISAQDFVSQLGTIEDDLMKMSPDQLGMIIPDIAKNMHLEDAIKGLEKSKYGVVALSAAAAGIEIPTKDMEAFKKAAADPTNARAVSIANKLQLKYNQAIRQGTIDKYAQIAADQKIAMINEDIAAATNDLATQTANMQNQTQAYDQLIQMGYDAATAYDLAQNSILATGIAAALAGDNVNADLAGIQEKINAFLEAQKSLPKVNTGGGGAAKKSSYQEAMDQLKQQRTEIKQTSIAYNRLRDAQFSVGDAFEAAKDPVIATALATTKVGTEKWVKLVAALKAANKEADKGALRDLVREMAAATENKQNQIQVSSFLSSKGWTKDQIDQITGNELITDQLAKDLADGKVNSKDLLTYLGQIKNLGTLDVKLNMTTKEGAEEEFNKLYDKAMDFFSAKKNAIELKFKADSAADQSLVESAQNQIAGLQYVLDDYEAGITEIENQEADVNSKYDKRIDALEKVQKLNDKIAKKQKAQLTIADALAQGDIAAAARAMQEKQAQDAQDAIDVQKESIQAAREAELAKLQSKSGMTRAQLETKIKDIKDQIFRIEEDTLEPAQERIRLLEVEKKAETDKIDAAITKWEELKNKIQLAKLTPEQEASLYAQAKTIADMLANWDLIEDKTATLTIVKQTIESNGSSSTGSSSTGSSSTGGTTTGNATSSTAIAPTANPAYATAKAAVAAAQAKVDNIANQMSSLKTAIANLNKQISQFAGIAGMASVVAAWKNDLSGKNTQLGYLGSSLTSAQSVLSAAKTKLANTPQYLNTSSGGGGGAGISLVAASTGGLISGYSSGKFPSIGTDRIPALLTPGEFVIRKPAVDTIGINSLKAINSGAGIGDSVYNYSVSVNVKSDANPDEIARSVMTQIRQIDSQRIRSNRY